MPKSGHIEPRMLEEAAEYYLSLQDGTMDADELKAWQGWMLAHDDHRRAFARLETLWGVLAQAEAEDFEALADAGRGEVVDKPAGGSVLGLVAPSGEPKAGAVRPSAMWFGAIAASVAAVFMASFLLIGGDDNPAPARTLQYETAASEQRVINLADGSIVELGDDSAVSVTYTETERSLTLARGEAVFTVAKNPKRPFVVRAGQGSVTAIGTVFNVRKSANNVQVRVLEGTVAVRPVVDNGVGQRGRSASSVVATAITLVTAGRQTEYSPAGELTPVTLADVHEGLGWRVGVLTMVDWRISDVIQELNRYLTDEITIGDEAVGSLRFTGTVYPDQVDAWLEGLQEGYPIEVVRLGGSTILMMADEPVATLVQ